jgi:hypothetical protein
LLHPLGTISHRVLEGGLKENKQNINIPESKGIFIGMLTSFERKISAEVISSKVLLYNVL